MSNENDDRLFHLEKDFEKHKMNTDTQFDTLIKTQQTNTESIAELITSVSSLVSETESIIQLHKDFQGAARVGKGVQGFLLWMLKWGTIGLGVVAAITWLVEKFNNAG